MQLNLTQSIKVGQEMLFNENPLYAAEAYDVVAVTIAHGDADKEVDLGALGTLGVLAIRSSGYKEAGVSKLTYKVGAPANPAITLSDAQMFVGDGMIALLGAVPDKLYFSNASATVDYDIVIVVGRDVTP